ncbi:type II toxin-antitoxin system RelE/ParE family toxin [Capnocytophaga sputigena]|uniref:type II toxin-antitoxin system RelE/ParE family toxin n=1 Tax=Capnocytophaga sputigena TaxID=1019 RepID=UPI0031F48B73
MEKEVAKISNTLKTFPKIGAIYESKGIRRVVILSNFSIFYRILEEQNEIEIIAFWDNRNDPEKLQF